MEFTMGKANGRSLTRNKRATVSLKNHKVSKSKPVNDVNNDNTGQKHDKLTVKRPFKLH